MEKTAPESNSYEQKQEKYRKSAAMLLWTALDMAEHTHALRNGEGQGAAASRGRETGTSRGDMRRRGVPCSAVHRVAGIGPPPNHLPILAPRCKAWFSDVPQQMMRSGP